MVIAQTSKAVVFDAYGPPEVLRIAELPKPRPNASEVTVQVVASTINPTDLLMRSGAQAAMMEDLTPPFIAGMEFSGLIDTVGSGVVGLSPGAAVIGVINPRTPIGGAHAQFVRVPADSIAKLASGVNLTSAATVPMNALTALMALEQLGLRRGSSVLVTGGAGMLGGSAIQLARLAGLRVYANGGPADRETLYALGADVVLPRDQGLREELSALCPEGVDGLIDGALIGAAVSLLVRTGGAAVSLRKSHPIGDPRLRCSYVSVTEGMRRTDLLRSIAKHIETGHLLPRMAMGGCFDYHDAIAAHRAAEVKSLRGRIIMQFSESVTS